MLCKQRFWPVQGPALGLPLMPMPGRALLSEGGMGLIPFCLAASSKAFAKGCSLPNCKPAALARMTSVSAEWVNEIKLRSFGLPRVSVPVLSKATIFNRCASSSTCGSLIRIPKRAAIPVPAMIAAGVAKPRAQGHAITMTDTALSIAIDTESK